MKQRIWFNGYLLFFLILFTPAETVPLMEGEVVAHYIGVLGGMVTLPCNITPPQENDELELVLWYKETIESPVYSTDVRRVSTHEPQHFVHNMWDSRAYFNMFHKPTGLKIINLKLGDAGVYRCRVDFQSSRTVNFKMTLEIVVPPSKPLITDERNEIVSGQVGPLPEGSSLNLKCETNGGNPKPSLKWFLNNEELADIQSRTYGLRTESHLVIKELKRDNANSNISCKAINNNISNPANTSVTILLYVKPMTVKIIQKHKTMVAGNSYKFVCESRGSVPPAIISWRKRQKKLKHGHLTISLSKNISTSVIDVLVNSDDDGSDFTCRALNTKIRGSQIEEKISLNVKYKPVVRLRMKSTLQNVDLYEGDVVHLDCNVRANPFLTSAIRWYHNDKMIRKSNFANNTTTINNSSLIISSLKFLHNGNYRCSASNSQGTSNSDTVTLDLKHSPICVSNLRKLYQTSIGSLVRIFCQVHSNSDVIFSWHFNSSTREKLLKTFTTNGRTSTLEYTPMTDLDYGNVNCQAKNSVGHLKKPCVFVVTHSDFNSEHLSKSSRPEEIEKCAISQHNFHILIIKCDKHYSESANQTYIMEVYDRQGDTLQANITRTEMPVFAVRGLSASADLIARIYAFNKEGRRSEIKSLFINALKKNDPQGNANDVQSKKLQPIVGAVVGLLVSMIFIAISIIFILRCRKPRQEDGYRSVTLPASTSSLTSQKHPQKSNLSNKLENGSVKKNIASIMTDDGENAFWDYCVSSLDSSSPNMRENALPLEHSSVYFKRKSRLGQQISSDNMKVEGGPPVAGCELPLMMKSTVEVSL